MVSSAPQLILNLLVLALSMTLGIRLYFYRKYRKEWLGWAATILGLFLAWVALAGSFRSQPAPSNLGVPTSGFVKGALALSDRGELGPTSATISLDLAGWSPERSLAIATQTGSWLHLDGSNGVRPEYKAWIESHFGAIQSPAGNSSQVSLPTCWMRNEAFPFARGTCSSRPILGTLAPGNHDLAHVAGGRAVAAVVKEGKVNVVLSLFPFERGVERSPEELCLQSLARGAGCVAAETFPSATLSAIAVRPSDFIQGQVFREFDIPRLGESDEALAIYDEDQSVTIETHSDADLNEPCGGMMGDQISALRLDRVASLLREARSERDLTRSLQGLDHLRRCPGLFILELPRLEFRQERSALRSLMTQLRERPIWLTTPKSLWSRAKKIAQVQLAWRPSDLSLWLRPTEQIEAFSMTVILPFAVSDAEIGEVRRSDSSVETQFFRTGPSSFRVSMNRLGKDTAILLPRLLLSTDRRGDSTFFDWTGFLQASLLAFTLATLTALLQSILSFSGFWRAFFPGTFSTVFSVVFLWVFLGYRVALAPNDFSQSVAAIERPSVPKHIFLRDWPDEWLKNPTNQILGQTPAVKDEWAKWATLFAEAKSEAKLRLSTPAGKVAILETARIPRESMPAGGRIFLWDDTRARNFHFRKNPDYSTWVLAWEALFKNRKMHSEMRLDTTAEPLVQSGPDLILIPDARFLSEADLGVLKTWVEGGGTLVVSDGPAPTGVSLPRAGEWLKAAGLGRGISRGYARVKLPGARGVTLSQNYRSVARKNDGLTGDAEPDWFGSTAVGEGRVFYLGLAPLESSTQDLLSSWLNGILGGRVVTVPASATCASSVLLEPWGAPPEAIRRAARVLRSKSVPVQWLVDAQSFTKMLPSWREEFEHDGVIFRDEGTRESREVASILSRKFKSSGDGVLVFARPRKASGGMSPSAQATEAGPDGARLVSFVEFPTAGNAKESLQAWNADCVFGAADPRLIPSAWLASELSSGSDSLFWVKDLASGKTSLVSTEETAAVLAEKQSFSKSALTRTLTPDRLNPLSLRSDPR